MSKIKPILFSTAMVQAEYANRKTQTRRTQGLEEVNKNPINWEVAGVDDDHVLFSGRNGEYVTQNRKYRKGDILWVRESFAKVPITAYGKEFIYKADFDRSYSGGWKPSIHMPKAAARIFLEVTNVRIERLQDISEADAIAEGIQYNEAVDGYAYYLNPQLPGDLQCLRPDVSFMTLWQSINGEESWDANPWVWVYDFKAVERPDNFFN
jgi:hypothetical protein